MKKLAVVTGASSGIGEAIAKRFSEAGYPLLLVARRLEKLEALNLPNCICEKVDVTDREAFESAVKKAEEKFGPVECMINNAGMMLLGQIDSQEPGEWEKMFELNVLALLGGMQIVLAPMKARKSGTIINISSVAGRKVFPNHAAYCGTKFAVSGLSECVREEVADDNVRVISICPGAAESELITHTTSDDIKTGYNEWRSSIGGAIAADDVARTVLYTMEQPQNVCIREIVMAPTRQQS